MRYLIFDPGNSTGWVGHDTGSGILEGGTIVEDFLALQDLIHHFEPDLVIYESFALYPGLAKSMAWNTFYPCEVIGVLKYICQCEDVKIVSQTPSSKKYSGGLDAMWLQAKANHPEWTEHTKDCYLHLRFYLRNTRLKREISR